ncbi:hypothetical protein DFJ58DRAFT_733779 [Suillus subalutaceus]|uniref:uncharacterized protein n=1 Tax=Suillus subalutaceus TaxID=48586 RepID=UPI001B886AEF|nr:uncharacterized protein DFJ58DRAFT_733779 [Suillus subalutaceus]KAG1838527.1 hypothetical protein DFJ58DRAFT_733779 [Suillus subalutaceus]
MAISGKPFSTDNLSDILFHITQMPGTTVPVQLAIRAVAFLLEKAADIETADKIATLVLSAVSPHIAKIQDVSESISSTAVELNITQAKFIELATTIDTESQTADADTNTATIDSRLEKMQEAVISLTTQVKEMSKQGGYKTALLTGLNNNDSNPNLQAVQRAAQNAVKARQILIDIPSDSQLAPGKISHAQLTEKIKQALTTITKEDTPELDIRSITQFRNGGTIVEMVTTQAAEYLRDQHIKDSFTQALDPGATLKE